MRYGWVIGAILPGTLAVAVEPMTATIRGERVNVRARPHPQAEVVGQLSEPATVRVRSVTNDWVEIVPPAEFDLWVHREFVENGAVTASKLVVRAGPGINYPRVGELKRGEPVRVRGEFGEWLKVEPPTNSSLWIAKSLVRLPEPSRPPQVAAERPATPPGPVSAVATVSTARPPPLAPPTGVSAPSAPAVTPTVPLVPTPTPVPPPIVAVPPPPPTAPTYVPEDLRLAPVGNQGAVVQREGRVRATMFTLGRPSRYQLVDESGGMPETSCYLRGNDAQLRSFLDRRLRIRGRQYWVQGSRYPVVVVDQIAVLPD